MDSYLREEEWDKKDENGNSNSKSTVDKPEDDSFFLSKQACGFYNQHDCHQ